jgi:hypothetical protein
VGELIVQEQEDAKPSQHKVIKLPDENTYTRGIYVISINRKLNARAVHRM